MRTSLRIRLTLIFIGLAIGPLLVVGVVLAQRSFVVEQEQALDLQNQVARQASTEIEAFIRDVENDLQLLGGEIRGLEQPDRAQQLSLLLGKFNSGPYRNVYEELVLLDNQGQEQLRLSRQETDIADEIRSRAGTDEFVQPIATRETYFGPVRFDATTGEPFMSIAIPLFRLRSVELSSVLIADVRFKEVGNLITDLQVSEGQTVYVVDSDGRVVAHQNSSYRLQDGQFDLPEQASTQAGLHGIDVVLAYDDVQLGGQQFSVVAEKPVSEALAPATDTVFTLVGTILISLAVAITLGLLVVRQIVQPIEALATTAQAFSVGDLSQRVRVKGRDELGALSDAFNAMAAQLHNLIGNLERGIRERTQALETSIDVSRQLTTILDLEELLHFVVDRIRTEFDFYHTHIYLVEAGSGDLVMAEGSGEVGRQLKEKGHRLKAGQGIVGTVASTNNPFMSNNVNEVANFVRNPLLLETQAELAVPLRKGEQVIGVLDIQSDQLNQFTSEDVALMQSIANQTAIAIDNARLLTETQAALEEVEHLNRRLTGEVWEKFTQELQMQGYRFSGGATKTITPDSGPWLLPPMKRAITEKQLVKESRTDNGDKSETELAVPLMLRGEVIGVLGVKREETPDWAEEEVAAVEAVAEQIARALENARLSKEQERTIDQLREVDRLKSEFLTSMSHELRTPLNSIIGFADVLLQGIDGELNERAVNDIQLIYNSGHHLLALINDILDLSKIEAGQMELVREPIPIKESVREALAATSSLFKDRPIEILADVEENIPPVYVDKLRFNQILLNLISNAAKFTAKGSVTIKAGIEAQAPGNVRISVIDTGIGIPPSKLSTVFDRFRQADSSTGREYGGSGLGLAICKQLVELHGGEIDVISEVDVGSQFYFTMPIVENDDTDR